MVIVYSVAELKHLVIHLTCYDDYSCSFSGFIFTTYEGDMAQLPLCSSIYLFYPPNVGKTVLPKAANEVKLISSGKILENNKTVGQCKVPFGEIGGGVIIMHVVVQPSLAKTKAGKFPWTYFYKEYITFFHDIKLRLSVFFKDYCPFFVYMVL